MDTDRLVDALVDELEPVQPLGAPWLRVACWLAVSLRATPLIVWAMGLRPDLPDKLDQGMFLAQQVAMLATALSGAWAALSATIPGTGRWRTWLPTVPLLLWLCLLAIQLGLEWPRSGSLTAHFGLDLECIPGIALTGLAPLVTIVALLRSGSAHWRGRAVFWGTLASAALANAGLRLFHPVDAALMVVVWQFGTVVALAGLAALARNLLVPPQSLATAQS